MKKKLNTKKGGFSLVEMLVVIAVIGIIAAIAIPNIGRINEDAKKRQKEQEEVQPKSGSSASTHQSNMADAYADAKSIVDVHNHLFTNGTIPAAGENPNMAGIARIVIKQSGTLGDDHKIGEMKDEVLVAALDYIHMTDSGKWRVGRRHSSPPIKRG